MAALALSFCFFAFLAAVGRATLEACRWRGGALRAWLLAPATGLAVLVLTTMVLSQAGLPVRAFATFLTLGLAGGTAAIFAWRRPLFPVRALAPFVLVALFSLLWTGWPMLRFGFGWLSYVNDDYVNYCLAAERFKDFGFWRVPTMEELAGRDISQYYWFMHVPGLMRFGSEFTLSWVSALTGVRALGIFMPVIVGLGLIQIFSAAALVLHKGRWRKRALIAAALLAASPLFMLGSLYQLIAQVGGLGLLLAAASILTSRLPTVRRRIMPLVLVLAILGAALAVYYPEVSSFPVLTTAAFAVIEWVRSSGGFSFSRLRATFPISRLSLVIYGSIGALVILRYNVLSYLFTIILQMGSGFRSVDLSLSLFPYFMIPTGLANLFGLMPLSVNFAEPFTSLSILAGLIALVTALGFAVRESFRPAPMALLLLVQFTLSLYLLSHGNDFGLYKAAMFMQPALAGSLACALLTLPRPRLAAPIAVLVIAGLCAPTALHYTRVSQGEKAGGITEAKLASILGTQPPATPPGTRLLADINNLVAAKVAAAELRGTDMRFLSRDYYQQIAPIEYERLGDTLIGLHPHFADLQRSRAMLEQRDENTIRTHSLFDTTFRAPALGFARGDTTDAYLLLDESLGLFNKLNLAPGAKPAAFFKELPAASVHNHLVFVHSGRGNHYYLGDRHRIALYQPETDLYTADQDITGLGRFLLLRVEKPDEEFYLRIAASKTFMGRNHTAWSPGSRILGATDVPLAFPGNGAVNRIVGPIRPVFRDGAAYIGLDFNETPVQFPFRRRGLQSLYNTQVPLDSRLLVAYGRDISALSAKEVATMPRPTRLARFPDDIVFARGLEFSGIYEDGWLSPRSDFVLAAAPAGGCVHLRGYVPELPGNPLGRGTLQLTINQRNYELPAAVGTFDWLLPVSNDANLIRVALNFTQTAGLPGGDDRPVGAKLEVLEILPALPGNVFDLTLAGAPRPANTGIDQDGWAARHAAIELPPSPTAIRLTLQIDLPGVPQAQATVLRASVAGLPATTLSIVPGTKPTLTLALPASTVSRSVVLDFDADFVLAAPDLRRRAARLLELQLSPAQ